MKLSIVTILLASNLLGASFSVEVSGTGKPVILIPGLGCSAEGWRETVDHFNKEGYQTHALTLAGFGGTKALASDRLLAAVRDDLATYIREKNLDHPIIIGHSLGGFLAIWLAETSPDLPGRVISVDGLPFLSAILNPAITPEEVQKSALEVLKRFAAASDDQLKQMQREALEGMVTAPENVEREMKVVATSDRGAFTETMLEMTVTDLRPQLAHVKAPLLMLGTWIVYKPYGATHDSATQLYAKQFEHLPSVKLVMNDTGKHFVQLDAPDWFYNQVDQFIQGK